MIPTHSYADIYERYASSVEWMDKLGIKLSPGRTAHYEKVLKHWKDAYLSASPKEVSEALPDFVSSNLEVQDFIEVYESFRDEPLSRLGSIKDKLVKAVNGPVNAAEETPKSTVARNFLFEAVVAARGHRPIRGVEAIFDAKSDTGISIDGKKLWIECKRVTTAGAIESNVAKASKQAESTIKAQVGSGHRGIVAIDVSKILNPKGQIFVKPNDRELLWAVDQMMTNFINTYSTIWHRTYERRTSKIIGTFIRFSFMANSDDRDLLVHASQWGVNPTVSATEAEQRLLSTLVGVMKERDQLSNRS